MKDGTRKTLCYMTNLCFALYFIILAAERLDSLFVSVAFGELFATRYSTIIYLALMASVVGAAVCLFVFRNNISFTLDGAEKSNYKVLCAASGILFVSRLLPTEHTVSWLQSAAYVILVTGIFIRAVTLVVEGKNPIIICVSAAYVVAFSMAIPAVYDTALEYADGFYIAQGAATLITAAAFAYIFSKLFNGEDVYCIPAIIAVVVFDCVVLAMKWQESENYFILAFMLISVILFAVGKILSKTLGSERAPALI